MAIKVTAGDKTHNVIRLTLIVSQLWFTGTLYNNNWTYLTLRALLNLFTVLLGSSCKLVRAAHTFARENKDAGEPLGEDQPVHAVQILK